MLKDVLILSFKFIDSENKDYIRENLNGLLELLNKIIDWNTAKFPNKLKDGGKLENKEDWEENKEFLGKIPKLEKGNTISIGGSVIGLLENSGVLISSSTGQKSLGRIFKDYLRPYESIISVGENPDTDIEIKVEDVEIEVPPNDYKPIQISSEFTNLLRKQKNLPDKNQIRHVSVGGGVFDFNIFFNLGKRLIYFPEKEEDGWLKDYIEKYILYEALLG